MNELIEIITQRTPLNADQAREVIQVVVDHFKARLPAPIAAQLDGLLAGGSANPGGDLLGAVEGELGHLFGGGR